MKADSEPEWSETERRLAALFKHEPPTWTEKCLEPEDHLSLAERGRRHPGAARLLKHLAGCAYCTREYAETWEALRAAEAARPGREPWWERLLAALRPAPAGEYAVAQGLLTSAGVLSPPRQRRRPAVSAISYPFAAAAAVALVYLALVRPNQLAQHRLQAQNSTLVAENTTLRKQAGQAAAASAARLAAKSASLARDIELLQKAKHQDEARLAALNGRAPQVRLADDGLGGGFWTEQQIASLRPSAATESFRTDITKHEVVMGGPEETGPARIDTVSPVDTVVAEDRPLLRWHPAPRATSYRVTVASPANDDSVVARNTVPGTTFSVPAALKRGLSYEWEVSAKVGDVHYLGKGRFGVMASAAFAQYTRMRADLRMKQAALDITAGLVEDAQRELQSIRPSDPLYAEAQARLKRLEAASPSR